jgi:hypothetical protein
MLPKARLYRPNGRTQCIQKRPLLHVLRSHSSLIFPRKLRSQCTGRVVRMMLLEHVVSGIFMVLNLKNFASVPIMAAALSAD